MTDAFTPGRVRRRARRTGLAAVGLALAAAACSASPSSGPASSTSALSSASPGSSTSALSSAGPGPSTSPLSTGPLSTGPLSTGPLSTGPLSTGPLSTGPGPSAGGSTAGSAAPYPSDTTRPDLVSLLAGYRAAWASDGELRGTVVDAATLSRDDRLAVWINRHATPAGRLRALQDSAYRDGAGDGYDQSLTVSTGLGSVLGPLYVRGRISGALPLTSALIDSSTGSAGAYVSTAAAKAAYSHPRPYLPSDPAAAPVAGDVVACAPTFVNAVSQRSIRVGRPWADADGSLRIRRVAPATDTTHRFAADDVALDPGYGSTGLCTGGSFPSGHTTTAYEAGITLATLLPELAPELLARASEAGNGRVVLGVHYPLDVMGGRVAGEAALAARWSDPAYRTGVLAPARAELVGYLERACGHALAWCARHQRRYASDPYAGAAMPGGTAQVVTDRRSAVTVYRERLTYGFPRTGRLGRAPSVPSGAAALLLTTFPSLTERQRTAVLAGTQIPSGYPLDQSGTPTGSWLRLDLAAAMSAQVRVDPRGRAHVVSTGGRARVTDVRSSPRR